MGAFESTPVSRSFAYSDSGKQDESPIFRNNVTRYENGDKLISTFRSQPEANSPIRLLNGSAKIYSDLNCNGERVTNSDGSLGRYEWITYKQFQQQVVDFSRGLRALGLQEGDKVGIYSHNCRFWQTTAYGSHAAGMIPVPVYDSLGPNAAQYIVGHSECKAVVVHQTKLASLLSIIPNTPSLQHIIIIGNVTRPSSTIPVHTTEEIIELGRKHPEMAIVDPDPDSVGMIMYTSGSTGKPKGCVLSHRNMIAGATGLGCLGCSITKSDVYYSFLPLAHIYELGVEYIMMAQGASVGFFSGSIKNMMDDFQALQPTFICGVPRVWNRIVDTMREKISNLPSPKKTLVNWAIRHKSEVQRNGENQSLLLDLLVMKDFKKALGGRVRVIVSGGAPILPDVYEFMKLTLCPIIIQGYGLTECAAGLAVQEYPEWNASNVGAISMTSEAKLRKVEGFNYDPRGTPMCGELIVRGPHVFKEYLKEPKLTEDAFAEKEWLATGDIVMITDDGLVQIIDRVKQLVKLSQGEYIAITSLNDIYGRAEGVQNIYVYADSHHDCPVAAVIPTKKKLEEWKAIGITDPVNSSQAAEDIVKSLGAIFAESKLRGFERITKVFIDLEEFSIENGLLTPSMKPQWQSLRKKYEVPLIALFDKK